MQNSLFLRLNSSDFKKGLITAVFVGILLPVLAMLQTPGFDISTVNWSAVLTLALNGALAGFGGYISKNLMTDSQGTFMGSAK